MKVVGISGKAGAGKDTAADFCGDYLTEGYGYCEQQNFAEALKECCAAKYGIPVAHFYDSYFKEKSDPYWGVSPRQILQFEGTECTRNTIEGLIPGISSDFWIRRLQKDHPDSSQCCLVVADVRFRNEANWVMERGILINITRPGLEAPGIQGHASEEGFSIPEEQKGNYYEVINDGTIEQLKTKIISILESHPNE